MDNEAKIYLDNYLGTNIKKYRTEKGLSQKQLAEMVGISTSYMQQLELGQKKSPSLEVKINLAKVLNVPMSELESKQSTFSLLQETSELLSNTISQASGRKLFVKAEEKTLISNLINDYNQYFFGNKYKVDNLSDKDIEELKPVIHYIVEMFLKNKSK